MISSMQLSKNKRSKHVLIVVSSLRDDTSFLITITLRRLSVITIINSCVTLFIYRKLFD